VYVATKIPVRSISVGLKSLVWCVAIDSSCYLRTGIQKNNVLGSLWLHVPREIPNLSEVSVGKNVIVALDENGKLSISFSDVTS